MNGQVIMFKTSIQQLAQKPGKSRKKRFNKRTRSPPPHYYPRSHQHHGGRKSIKRDQQPTKPGSNSGKRTPGNNKPLHKPLNVTQNSLPKGRHPAAERRGPKQQNVLNNFTFAHNTSDNNSANNALLNDLQPIQTQKSVQKNN